MDAKELRIGNYVAVNDRNGDYVVLVAGITAKDIAVQYGPEIWSMRPDETSPVCLTEGLILRSGGCSDFGKPDLSLGCFKLLNYNTHWKVIATRGVGGGFSETKVKYLHQLQNLYFALTGEELKINL